MSSSGEESTASGCVGALIGVAIVGLAIVGYVITVIDEAAAGDWTRAVALLKIGGAAVGLLGLAFVLIALNTGITRRGGGGGGVRAAGLAAAQQARDRDLPMGASYSAGWYVLVWSRGEHYLLAIDPRPGEPGGVHQLPEGAAILLLIPADDYHEARRAARSYLAGVSPKKPAPLAELPGLGNDEIA